MTETKNKGDERQQPTDINRAERENDRYMKEIWGISHVHFI